MACEDDEKAFMIRTGETVLADDMGRTLDRLAMPSPPMAQKDASGVMATRPRTTACIRRVHTAVAPSHGQDIVVDPAGNAFSVRVHLAQHLRMDQRVKTLEADVADLQARMNTQQSQIHDLRKQDFVTQGAFRAAQLCKADQGAVKLQRGKLDIVCKLLVSAGILEEGGSGGLCVREHKEESKTNVVQQVSDGNGNNTVYLEECIARTEEDIARIEKASAAAIEAMTLSLRVRMDEKCQQVQKECCDGLEESLESSGERIETNSTRIFRLAAEVEGLARTLREHGAAARPAGIAREETGEVFSVEIADLPQQQTTATTSPPPKPADKRTPTERRQKRSAVRRRENDEPDDTKGNARRSSEGPIPHPGVLGEPRFENGKYLEGGVRSEFFATSRKQATSQPAWRRRHSTYVGRRVVVSQSKEGTAAARMAVGPMRPQEDSSVDEQGITRTSSWPLLPNEAVAVGRRLQGVRGSEQVGTDAGAGGEGNHNSVRGDASNLELVLHGGDRPGKTKPTPVGPGFEAMTSFSPLHRRAPAIRNETEELLAGTRPQDDIAQRSQQSEDLSENHHAVDNRTNSSRQPPPSPRTLAKMTASEAAEALQRVTTPSSGRRVNTSEEQNGSSSTTTAVGVDTGCPGARLAGLVDTPDLWCPRDTWDDVDAAELSSSEGSSTVVPEGCRQKSRDASSSPPD